MVPKPKKRQSRMHAAIDAMRPLGFSSKTVQYAVKALLKEYGGDENWHFIECDAYDVLLNSMLEDKKGDNQKETSSVGENLRETSREGADTAIGTTECGGTDAATSKLALSRVCSKSIDTVSHALQIVANRNEDSSEAEVLKTPPINSQPLKVLALPMVKALKPKSENGWLSEEEEEEEEEDDDNGSNFAKSNLARNLARLKRKRTGF